MVFTAKQRVKKIIEWATGDPNYVDDMQGRPEADVKVVLSQDDLYNIEDEIRTAYELGYQEATKDISSSEVPLKLYDQAILDDGGSTYIQSLQHWVDYNPFDGDSNWEFLHSILADKLEELKNAKV